MEKDDDVSRELRSHLELETEERAATGLPPDEARYAALRAFGNPTLVKEEVRDLWPGIWWERLRQDVRYGLRAIRRQPGFAAVVVLSLGLGIGANTAIFSILNTLVLKTLPVREPERLALLDKGSWTNPIWEGIRERQDALFDGAFAWSTQRFDLSEHGETDLVDGGYASGRMFDVLGVHPALGRLFSETDDLRGGGPDGPVAVISYAFWQRRYGGALDVLGRHLTVEHVPFTVIGVMPSGFFGPDVGRASDVFVPIADEAFVRGKESWLDQRSNWWLEVIVRLKAGQPLDQAASALQAIQPQIREATLPGNWPATEKARYLTEALTLVPAAAGRSDLRGRYKQPLTIILVVVGAVLFIACANIANLVLARTNARRHELTVRLALGASRLRLARQLLTESLILAVAGAALGLALARWGAAIIVSQLGRSVSLDLSTDWRVLAFTSGVALATVLLFGLIPALGVARLAPNEALKETGRSIAGDRRFGLRNALVVAQVALSVALVVGAGLFLRTLVSLTTVPLGFDPASLLIVNVTVQPSRILPDQRPQLYDSLQQAAAAVPGVASAALSSIAPVSGQGWNNSVAIPGGPVFAGRESMTWMNAVSPSWFATYGMHVLAGRNFNERDRAGGPPVIVVNEAFVRHFFKGQNPIGREVKQSGFSSGKVYEVAGLVSDSVYRSPRQGAPPTMYVPMTQTTDRPEARAVLTVRAATGSPGLLTRSLATALNRASPDASFTFRPMVDQTRASVSQERLVAILAGFFGALALLLAAIGLYGVTSYAVNRRRAEIGIRMALGANPARVVRLVLRRVGWLVGTGVVAGAMLSFWASRFIASSLLFGIEARDPGTFGMAATVLAAIGLLAGWLPARRASRIDPTTVLRES